MKKVLSIVLTLALLLSVLPMALGVTASAAEATGTGDYAIYFDNSSNGNNFWVTKRNDDHPEIGMEELNLPAGNTYTVEFDVYALTAGSNVVFGATKATWDTTAAIENGHQVWKSAPATVEEWTHYSFNVNTTETWKGVIFYVTGDGFKGYIDNLTIKDSTGKVAASFEPTADDLSKTSNCGSIVELTAELAYAKNYDYGIYIDNSANTIQSNAIWFNILGAPKMSLEPDKTYTLKFDNYALNASTSGHLYVGVNSTGGGITGQNWWNTRDVVGEWATQSVNFTFTGANLAYHTIYVGAGFKGYMDNFRVYDGDTEVARWEIDKSSLGKENSGASVVLLPQEISEAKNIAYKIEIDAEGKLFRTAYDGSLGEGASIKFDYYLVSGKVKVDGTNDSGAYLNKGVGSFELSVPVSKSFTITSRSAEFVELYIWNIEITQAGTPLEFKSYEGRTNCDWEKILLSKVPEYVEKDYGMLVDTTSVAADGSANKSFWFNELGMDSYYNTLVAGETYTFAFDVYPLTKTEDINLFHFRTSSGSTDVWGGFWKGNNLVVNEWNTTSTTFTVDDASKTGNHILFVFGGFKGYVDNVRIIDKDGNVVSGTSTDFTGLTVPEKHNAYLTIAALPDALVEEKEVCIHSCKVSTVNPTYFANGSKNYYCDLCEDTVASEVIPAATNAVKDYKVTLNADNTVTISWGYTDDFVLDLAKDPNAVVKFNYEIAGYENAVEVNGNESGAVTLNGFNAARLGAELKYWISVESSVLGNTSKLVDETTKTVVASTLVDGDSDLGKLMAAINSATDEAAVVAGQVNNTATLVSNTMKADLKAGTLDLRFVASQDLITKLNTLGKVGRTVTLTVTIGDTVTKNITIETLKKVTMVKISGMSFEQLNSKVTVKLGFDYADNANNFETDVVEFNCGEIIADTDTAVANAFEAFMK